jgi:aminomethyltransferase
MTERRTPLYDFHFRSARNIVKGGGDFMFPTSYTSPVEEHLNVRRNVGMQDLSTMGEVDIKGPGSERLVRRLLVNEVQDMEPGQLRYSTMCNEEGGIVDDVTVYKFGDEHFMVVTSSGPRLKSGRPASFTICRTRFLPAPDCTAATADTTYPQTTSRSYSPRAASSRLRSVSYPT